MTDAAADPPETLTRPEEQRAARLVRRLLGQQEVDELAGTQEPDDTVRVILANEPTVDTESVMDGFDLVSDRLRDHPRGTPLEQQVHPVGRVRNLLVAWFFIIVVVTYVVGLFGRDDDDPIETMTRLLPSGVMPWILWSAGLAGVIGLILMWLTVPAHRFRVLGEARHAVRWATRREGQLGRGLPVVDPFGSLARPLQIQSAFGWVLGGIALVVAIAMGDQIGPWGYLLAVMFLVIGWSHARARRELLRASRVAREHLFLLEPSPGVEGLRTDVSTSVRKRFLISQDPRTPGWQPIEERVVYPLTSHLSPQGLADKHEEVADRIDELRLVGERTQAPLVTAEPYRPEVDNDPYVRDHYGNGWVVAHAMTERPVVVIVADQPERFLDEVLPAFGERHGLAAGSIDPVTPWRVSP